MVWDPTQYDKFERERAAPFFDLLDLVEKRKGISVVDLGCGTGKLTQILSDALPESQVTGIDNSETMLEKARPLAGDRLCFEHGTVEELHGSWDLIFSNAALHWIADHAALLPKLWSMIQPGGQLAVQVPSNHNHMAHRMIFDLGKTEPYATQLNHWTRVSPVQDIDWYGNMLFKLGAKNIRVSERIYPGFMEDSDAVVEWNKGTVMVPYKEKLGELWPQFLEAYRQKLKQAWPDSPLMYGYRRTLFAAQKP